MPRLCPHQSPPSVGFYPAQRPGPASRRGGIPEEKEPRGNMGGATLLLRGFTKEAGLIPHSSHFKLWQSMSEILYFMKILPWFQPGRHGCSQGFSFPSWGLGGPAAFGGDWVESYPMTEMRLRKLDRMWRMMGTADEPEPPSPQQDKEQMSLPDHPRVCFRAWPAPVAPKSPSGLPRVQELGTRGGSTGTFGGGWGGHLRKMLLQCSCPYKSSGPLFQKKWVHLNFLSVPDYLCVSCSVPCTPDPRQRPQNPIIVGIGLGEHNDHLPRGS